MTIQCRYVHDEWFHYTMTDGGYLVYEAWINKCDVLLNELYDYARRVSADMGIRYGEIPQMAQRKDLLN